MSNKKKNNKKKFTVTVNTVKLQVCVTGHKKIWPARSLISASDGLFVQMSNKTRHLENVISAD